MSSRNPALTNLILVGCVKSKRSHTSAALYNSRLWRCRRAYAERASVRFSHCSYYTSKIVC